MSINKDSQKAPNLRFKGFTDDWEQRKFEDVIISIQTGTNLLGAESNHGIPLIKMGNIQRGFFSFKKVEFLKENEEVDKRDMANFGDFLFNTRNTLELVGKGATWFGENDKFAFNSNIARFTFEGINTIFFNYLYNTPKMIKQVQARAVGTTSVAAVYPKDLNSIKLWIPSENVQKKIGSFFKHLDNSITLHQRKLDQLNQLKAALLQQMFPGKGETVPKLRFADFNDEWEERKLGEMVGTISSGNRLPKSELTKGNVPYIVAQTKNNGVFGYISENTKDYNGNDMKLFPSNSISFSIDNPEAIFYRNEPFYTSNIMRVIHNETLSEFDYIFIIESMKMFTKSYDWSRKFSGPIVSNLKIMFPMDNEEQLKIGQFFKQLDNTITLQQRKLEQLQNMKQVLLQNMFT